MQYENMIGLIGTLKQIEKIDEVNGLSFNGYKAIVTTEEKKHKRWYCALTDEECIYTADRETCVDCPICEDAKEKEKEC